MADVEAPQAAKIAGQLGVNTQPSQPQAGVATGAIRALPPTGPDPQSVLAAHSVKGIDPATAVGIAKMSPDPESAINTARTVSQFSKYAKTAKTLSSQPASKQIDMWSQMSANDRNQLAAAGYKVPFGPPQPNLPTHGIHAQLLAYHVVKRAAESPAAKNLPPGTFDPTGVDSRIVGEPDKNPGPQVQGGLLGKLGLDTTFNHIVHGTESVAKAGVHLATHPSQIPGQMLKGASQPFKFVSHIGRAVALSTEQATGEAPSLSQIMHPNAELPLPERGFAPQTSDFFSGNAGGQNNPLTHLWGQLFDPSDWSHVLNPTVLAQNYTATENGATSFDPNTVRDLKPNYSAPEWQILSAAASGIPPAQILKGIKPANQNAAQEFMASPEFQSGVGQLTHAHLDFGTVLVGQAALNQPGFGKVSRVESGALNATYDVYADPVLGVSKLHALSEVAKYAWTADSVRTAYRTDTGVKTLYDGIAKELNKTTLDEAGNKIPNVAAATAKYTSITGLSDDLSAMGKKALAKGSDITGQDVSDMFAAETAKGAMLQGRAGLFYHGEQLIPHISALKDAALDGKVEFNKMINWAADKMPAKVRALSPGIRIPAMIPTKIGTGLARIVRSTVKYLPEDGIMDLTDPASTDKMGRLANYSLPADRAAEIKNMWAANAGDPGKRFDLFKSSLDEIFNRAGLYNEKATSDWAHERLNALSSQRDGAVYMPNGEDLMKDANDAEGEGHAAGVFLNDLANRFAIPPFREFQQQVQKVQTLSAIGGKFNNAAITWSMQHLWKPLLLMRYGFALRAGGEELANAMFRLGPKAIIKSAAARSAAKDELVTLPAIDGAGLPAREFMKEGAIRPYQPLAAVARKRTLSKIENAYWKAENDAKELNTIDKESSPDAWDRWNKNEAHRIITDRVGMNLLANGTDQPVEAAYRILTQNWPQALKDSIRKPTDLMAAAAGFGHKAIRFGQNVIAGPEYMASALKLAEHGVLDGEGSFAGKISAIHGDQAGLSGNNADEMNELFDGNGLASAKMVTNGKYKLGKAGDDGYHYFYAGQLDKAAKDPLATTALMKVEQGNKAQSDAVFNLMKSGTIDDQLKKAERYYKTPDGALVSDGPTRDAALRDWADHVVKKVNGLVKQDDGRIIRMKGGTTLASSLVDHGEGPGIQYIRDLADRGEELPSNVIMRDLVPVPTSTYDALVQKGMKEVVGRPMDWMSRQPIFLANYHMARLKAEEHLGASVGEERVAGAHENLIHDLAMDRAVNETIPFIHNPRIRSQFESNTRNLFPFMFAQRQFFRRWARVAAHSPEAFRKAQLVMNGLRSTGFVHQDPQTGEDQFSYPLTGFIDTFLQKHLPLIYANVGINVASSMTGNIQDLTPGFSGPLPTVDPVLALGLQQTSDAFPELIPFRDGVLQQGANQDWISDLTPSVVSRLIGAYTATPEGNAQMAGATVQAMQYLESTGHGLPNDATQTQVNAWANDIQLWARNLLVTRAIMGFVVPAAPQIKVDPLHLAADLQTLVNEMPYEQALTTFIKEHPNAIAYTVGGTTTPSGAELPSTNAGLDFIDNNRGFMNKYNLAAPWLIPSTAANGPFNEVAYQQQLVSGMRVRRTPDQWWEQVQYATYSKQYYATEDQIRTAQNADPHNYEVYQKAWNEWSTAYLSTPAHAGFAASLNDSTTEARRANVIAELNKAVNDPEVPQTTTTTAVADLLKNYNTFKSAVDQYKGIYADDSKAYQLRQIMQTWGTAFVQANPEAASFYNVIIKPEIGNA